MKGLLVILFLIGLFVVTLSLTSDSAQKGEDASMEIENPEKFDWKSQSEDFWKERLSSEQYRVCRESGTEKPFSGKYCSLKDKGSYKCSSCGQKLFDSKSKFDSGTGWPSYYEAEKDNVTLHEDSSLFVKRTEVKCSRCDAHLGHVFNDGPEPTGKRYCVNSVCLDFSLENGAKNKSKKGE